MCPRKPTWQGLHRAIISAKLSSESDGHHIAPYSTAQMPSKIAEMDRKSALVPLEAAFTAWMVCRLQLAKPQGRRRENVQICHQLVQELARYELEWTSTGYVKDEEPHESEPLPPYTAFARADHELRSSLETAIPRLWNRAFSALASRPRLTMNFRIPNTGIEGEAAKHLERFRFFRRNLNPRQRLRRAYLPPRYGLVYSLEKHQLFIRILRPKGSPKYNDYPVGLPRLIQHLACHILTLGDAFSSEPEREIKAGSLVIGYDDLRDVQMKSRKKSRHPIPRKGTLRQIVREFNEAFRRAAAKARPHSPDRGSILLPLGKGEWQLSTRIQVVDYVNPNAPLREKPHKGIKAMDPHILSKRSEDTNVWHDSTQDDCEPG